MVASRAMCAQRSGSGRRAPAKRFDLVSAGRAATLGEDFMQDFKYSGHRPSPVAATARCIASSSVALRTGLVMCASHPASLVRCRFSSRADAVSARIGVRGWRCSILPIANRARGRVSVDLRHLHVHQHHVVRARDKLVDRDTAVLGLVEKVGGILQIGAHQDPVISGVVGQHDPQRAIHDQRLAERSGSRRRLPVVTRSARARLRDYRRVESRRADRPSQLA